MIFPILQKCCSSVSRTLCMYVKDNRVIFWQRTLVPENSKWYRLSEKHMKRFVVVPRDLTDADSPGVPCGRSSSLPLRPYFPLCHRTGCFCCSFWCTSRSSTTTSADKLACCPHGRIDVDFCSATVQGCALHSNESSVHYLGGTLSWYGHTTNEPLCQSYVLQIMFERFCTTRIDDEMLFLHHPPPLPLAPSVAVLSFYLFSCAYDLRVSPTDIRNYFWHWKEKV